MIGRSLTRAVPKNEELEQQLKAGRLEKLPELRKDFFTEKRVEESGARAPLGAQRACAPGSDAVATQRRHTPS